MSNPEDILGYWLDEVGTEGWFKGGEALDVEIRDLFEDDWNRVMCGTYAMWLTYPNGTLAYTILTDQFPRNMFRGTGKAFASDGLARAASKVAIARGWDLKVEERSRLFFYYPLMHSECLADQDRCVRLMLTRMPTMGAGYLRHAKAHREVIRLFGRFPTRNEALERADTPPEAAFVQQGGYRKALEMVDAA